MFLMTFLNRKFEFITNCCCISHEQNIYEDSNLGGGNLGWQQPQLSLLKEMALLQASESSEISSNSYESVDSSKIYHL